MADKLKIEIEAIDKASGAIEKAAKSLKSLSSSIRQTAAAAETAEKKHNRFVSSLTSGSQKASKYVEQLNGRFKNLISSLFSLQSIAAAALSGMTFGKIVEGGIQFNAQLQVAKLGLAALITSSYQLVDAQGKTLSGMEAFHAAQEKAKDLYQEILERSMKTAATSRELVSTFQAILPYAAQTKMSLEQSLNMAEAFVNAAKAMGLGLGQAAQEARALFMGDIDQNSQLLRALNISKEMVDAWKKQGVLYEEVMRKLQPFVQASDEFADTWEGVTSSVSDLISMLEGSVFKDTFRIMNDALKKIRDSLQDVLKDENKLNDISEEIAYKFIDAAETVITAADSVYQFGKKIYDFVTGHPEITKFGILGYLLLGSEGVALGAAIGTIKEIAESTKDSFPTEKEILKKMPNSRAVLGISPQAFPQEVPNGNLSTFKPPPFPTKVENLSFERNFSSETEEGQSSFAKKLIDILEKAKENIGKQTKNKVKVSAEPPLESFSPYNYDVEELTKPLPQKVADTLLKDKPLVNLPSIFTEPINAGVNIDKEFGQQYLEYAKQYKPEEWKQYKLQQLKNWYEEHKKILGDDVKLQELYEHKRLEIEKEAEEAEKKLYMERLRQTSGWKAGMLQALDELSKKWGDTNQLIYDATVQTFSALKDTLSDVFFDAMQGKLKKLSDYVNAFLTSVERSIANFAAAGVAQSIVSFGAGFFAADGGIIPGHFVPLKAFATGGVVDQPTVGLVGEGKYPEAIVPLPDGRSIPVKMTGQSQNQTIEIVLVDDRSKIPPPQIGKKQVVLWVAEDYSQNGILRKVIKG